MLAIPRLGIIRLIASITTATTSRETAGGQPVMSKRIIRASSMKSSALIQVKSLTPPDSFIARPVAKSRYRYSLDNCHNSPCSAVTILAASCAPHIGSASIPLFRTGSPKRKASMRSACPSSPVHQTSYNMRGTCSLCGAKCFASQRTLQDVELCA